MKFRILQEDYVLWTSLSTKYHVQQKVWGFFWQTIDSHYVLDDAENKIKEIQAGIEAKKLEKKTVVKTYD